MKERYLTVPLLDRCWRCFHLYEFPQGRRVESSTGDWSAASGEHQPQPAMARRDEPARLHRDRPVLVTRQPAAGILREDALVGDHLPVILDRT